MIVIHKSKYNPKIDFIVCKQLMNNLPKEYDEIALRNAFLSDCPQCDYEKQLLEIKHHFESHSADMPYEFETEKLMQIITGKNVDLSDFIYKPISNVNDIEKIVRYVSEIEEGTDTLFQVLLLLCYCSNQDVPVLPYHGICRSLYYSIIVGNFNEAELIWQRLIQRQQKYCNYHDLLLNDESVFKLKKHKQDFLAKIPDAKLALYGSLATGNGTNYSDLDILIIVPKAIEKETVKILAYNYWSDKISISFDISVEQEDELDNLPIAIKRSIRYI